MNLWRDLGTDRLSWRHFGVLVKYLPPESIMFHKVHPDPLWDVTDFLLADLVDIENMAIWQRGGGKGKKPEPVPRPRTGKERARLSNEEMAKRLLEQRDRKG